jgi:hypothetical protein
MGFCMVGLLRVSRRFALLSPWHQSGASGPPEGLPATHRLACALVKLPPTGPVLGTLFLGPLRAAFVRDQFTAPWTRNVALSGAIEIDAVQTPAAARWVLLWPSHMVRLKDANKCLRLFVGQPSELLARIKEVVG